MRTDEIGLTKLYNRFHNPEDRDGRLERLREIQCEVDAAVARVYEWNDLKLSCGFHDVPFLGENDRLRFTISEAARTEVLRRLSELNRQRHEEEVAQMLHRDATLGAPTRAPRVGLTASAATVQASLDFDVIPTNEGHYAKVAEPRADYRVGPVHAIVEYLNTNSGWHAKADVLAATGITDGQWNAAINDLIAGRRVERQGQRRGARYRISPYFSQVEH
jgi:hypothetical protein